jgi:hypothetical protein
VASQERDKAMAHEELMKGVRKSQRNSSLRRKVRKEWSNGDVEEKWSGHL